MVRIAIVAVLVEWYLYSFLVDLLLLQGSLKRHWESDSKAKVKVNVKNEQEAQVKNNAIANERVIVEEMEMQKEMLSFQFLQLLVGADKAKLDRRRHRRCVHGS